MKVTSVIEDIASGELESVPMVSFLTSDRYGLSSRDTKLHDCLELEYLLMSTIGYQLIVPSMSLVCTRDFCAVAVRMCIWYVVSTRMLS